jgi:hypothetical protein
MTHPITLADFKIGSNPLVIELVESTVTIRWPSSALSVSERRFPDVAAQLTRVISSAAMELARIKAGNRS